MQGSLCPETSLRGAVGVSGVARGARFRPSKIITIKYYLEHTLTRMVIIVYLQFKVNWVSCALMWQPQLRGESRARSRSCVSKPCCPGPIHPAGGFCHTSRWHTLRIISGCRTFLSHPPVLPEMLWDPPCPCYKCLFYRKMGRAACERLSLY